jgi:drug/metabolite transporter (DMT)-like permease
MPVWLPILFFAAASWAAHVVFLKILGERLTPLAATLLFYLVALTATALFFFLGKEKLPLATVTSDWRVAVAVLGAGIAIALTDYFFVKGLSYGAPISLFSPALATLELSLVALAGLLLFGEVLTLTKLAGFAFAALGFFLIVR